VTRLRNRRLLLATASLALTLLLVILLSNRPGGLLDRLLFRQDPTWRTMQATGIWRVGLDPSFPPFEMLDAAGKPTGYDVDLAQRMAARWGMTVQIVPMGYDSLLDALAAGRVDSVVSALPYDPRATQDYWFSPPYFEAGVRLVVRAGSPISSTAHLTGARVAVEWGSMGDMVGRRLHREGIDLELVPYETPDAAAAALAADSTLDALLIDQVSLRQAQGRGLPLSAVGPALESNPYVIAAPLRAADLHTQIAATLDAFAQTGVLDQLEARWFQTSPGD
jgi:ABC-type amino acid transport substrate-binding protein